VLRLRSEPGLHLCPQGWQTDGHGSERSDTDDEVLSDFSDEKFSDSDDESDIESEDEDVAAANRQAAMDKLVAPLEPGEYGKMPSAFHENSQPVAEPEADDHMEVAEAKEATDTKGKAKDETPLKMRPPIIPRDKYEGVDSDDESEDDEDGGNELGTLPDDEEESDEDRPQVVGEVEIDMEEEEEEFLEFSRKALGISDEQWGDIIRDRKARGGELFMKSR
jgi:hypothetical protein